MRATYRLQLGPGMSFARGAARWCPTSAGSGSATSTSRPCLQARHGSTHGYDVIDPRRVSEDLGGEAGLRELAGAGLDVLLDVVPNHMATDDENPFWADPALRERFFDIDPETGRHRRFFSIDELAGVRVEDPEVFETTHALDPAPGGRGRGGRPAHRPPRRPRRSRGLPRAAWPSAAWTASGWRRSSSRARTCPTGRWRARPATSSWPTPPALFIDPAGEEPLTALYARADRRDARDSRSWAPRRSCEEARTTFEPEVERLRSLLDEPGMAEAVAALPVYRTYLEPETDQENDPHDVRGGGGGRPCPSACARPSWLRRTPTRRRSRCASSRPPGPSWPRASRTPPSTATPGWSRSTRWAPTRAAGASPPTQVHAANAERAERFPRGLLATQTHDTKRSGDVRARIGALSGMAGEWRDRVLRWREMNAPLRAGGAPDPGEEYLIYQTLVGRLAARARAPARLHGQGDARGQGHHRLGGAGRAPRAGGADGSARGLYASARVPGRSRGSARGRGAPLGERSALGQTLLKLTSPGVPDIYQGDELWCLSLVDPDNRRPVDWERRRAAAGGGAAAAAPPTRETAKMFLIHRALDLRARRPEAFAGAYEPLDAGEAAIAYARGGEVIAATPIREGGGAEAVRIPADRCAARWRSVLTGAEIRAGGTGDGRRSGRRLPGGIA